MAESFVNINDATKKLHTFNKTIGANDVHDEVVIAGEPYLASYAVAPLAVSVATANDHILQIMAGASLVVYIRRIRIWQMGLATAAAYGNVQLLRLSTAGTGGSSSTPVAFDPNEAASGATAMTTPTAKGTETTRLFNWSQSYTQTVGATPAKDTLLVDLDFDVHPRLKPIRINAGTANGICIKHVTAIAAATVFVSVEFSEANF